MNMPRAAAIYARISSDVEGAGAGVARQVADCQKAAERLGWTVAETYVDNDISAFSGKKRRPEYERMLTDLSDGLIDGVLVYNMDRLTRHPPELEHFHDVVKAAKVTDVHFVTGDADLSTVDGLLMARILGAFAAKESANIGRRVARKMEQNAIEGKPHGSRRPFGYADDMKTILPEEAAIYRALVARFLAGESGRSLATWLNDEAVGTVTGASWASTTVKGMLTNPRYAGLRAHKGTVVGPGQWEAIISEDEHRRVLAAYAAKKGTGRRTPQRYLLSGLLRCGKCGVRLYSSSRVNRNGSRTRRYVCMSGPDHGGCGRMTITADALERLVADAVLYRLDTTELADTIAGRSSADERTQALSATLEEATAQLEELSLAYANRDITMSEWMIAKKPIIGRQESAQRQLASMTRTGALSGLVGNGQELGRTWGSLNLSRQHAIVAALVDHVMIGPGAAGVTALDPARVGVVWRY